MQVFTVDFAIQIFLQAKAWQEQFFGILLNAVGENIVTYGIATWNDLVIQNWTSPNIFILACVVVYGFFIVRQSIIDSTQYLLSKIDT